MHPKPPHMYSTLMNHQLASLHFSHNLQHNDSPRCTTGAAVKCLFTLGILLFAPGTLANGNYMSMTLEQLLNVKVHSAAKKTESLGDSSAAIYAITSADIERAGVTTIPDALRMVPGVEVAQADSNSWAISIRGFNGTLANKLLVLVDGRTIYNPVFGGVLWEAHELMLENIERIEVIRGPGGSLWGANAVNGVINITTKHTRDTQGTLISAVAGDEEKGTLNARQGGVFGARGTYRVYAKGFKRDSALRPDMGAGSPTDNYDEWDGYRGGFRMDWADEFTLQGDAYRTDAQQLRPDFSFTAPTTIEQQTIIYEGANLLGRWTDKKWKGPTFSMQAYVDWNRRDEPFNFIDDRTTVDLEAQYDFVSTERHAVIVGAGARWLFDDREGNRNVEFTPQEDDYAVYNAFVQDKITLVPERWFLTLGTKLEHNDFSGSELQPNARLQWLINNDQSFWTAISHAVRTPTPLEEDLTSTLVTAPGIRVAFVPNDDVASEELTAYEVGYRHQFTSDFSVDLTAFYNDYDKLSSIRIGDAELINNGIDPLHFLVPVQFVNNMYGHTRGAEITSGWTITPTLQVSASYSYLYMSLTSDDEDREAAERLSPRHRASARVYWDIREHIMLGTTISYADRLPASDVDSYVRLDLNLGVELSDNVRFNLVGQNLLDPAHREFGTIDDLNAAEIERSIFAKLTWQFR